MLRSKDSGDTFIASAGPAVLALTLFVCLFLPEAATGDDYEMDIGITVGGITYAPGHPMDTLWTDRDDTFDFYYKNADTLGCYTTGFTIWTPDGATWTYDTAILRIDLISGTSPPEYDTIWAVVTMVPDSRQYPVGTVWDHGFDIYPADTNGAPRDTIMWGGMRKAHGLYPGPLERQALIHIRTGGVSGNEVKTICIDSCKVGPAGDFIFGDYRGVGYIPTTLWPEGGRCYAVKKPTSTIICGDANDDKTVNLGDAVFINTIVFHNGPMPDPPCKGDANGDGSLNLGDAVYLNNLVFLQGPAPVTTCCPW